MIEDIQKFESIAHDEDTKEEPITSIYLLLSTIESMNPCTWKEWIDEREKVNISFKSGLQVTILGNITEVAKLWYNFLKQQRTVLTHYN